MIFYGASGTRDAGAEKKLVERHAVATFVASFADSGASLILVPEMRALVRR
jgi:hypothetical protein